MSAHDKIIYMPIKSTIAPALKALVENLIDYAGIYPPAALPLDTALDNYNKYRNSDYSWMLRSLVIGSSELEQIPPSFDGLLAILSETDNKRAASLETKGLVEASRPVYCEIDLDNLQQLDAVKRSGCFAKIRTGGIKPEAIPSPKKVADFILDCAQRELAFKATAGLHHPIRAMQALTYEADAPKAIMHGFINVLMASAFAWHGEKNIEPILSETNPQAFAFDQKAHWGNMALDAAQIRKARLRFMHSIGSCSFDEPVDELKALGLI
jgi:hypothetical protein